MFWVFPLRWIAQDSSSNAAYTPICVSIHRQHFSNWRMFYPNWWAHHRQHWYSGVLQSMSFCENFTRLWQLNSNPVPHTYVYVWAWENAQSQFKLVCRILISLFFQWMPSCVVFALFWVYHCLMFLMCNWITGISHATALSSFFHSLAFITF